MAEVCGDRNTRGWWYNGWPVEQWLGFGDIQAGPADQAAVQGVEQGLLVEQAAAGNVDQVQAGAGIGQDLAVDQATGGRSERGGQHQMVAAGEQLSQVGHRFYARDVCDALAGAAQGQNPKPQGHGLARQALADTAEAEDAQGATTQRGQRGQAPVGVLDP